MRRNACVVLAAFACSLAVAGVALSTTTSPREVMPSAQGQGRHASPPRHVALADAPLRHSARYLTAAKLSRGIRAFCRQGSGACVLRGQAFVIEDVAFRERVSGGFMVGAAMTESSGGDAACGRNLWGLNSCRGGNFIHGPVPAFRDYREAFTYFARFVKERWPGARTVYDLVGYCGCGTAAWGNRTSYFMARMGFGGGRLAYP